MIRKLTEEGLYHVVENLREVDFKEVMSLRKNEDRLALAEEIHHYPGMKFEMIKGGGPVAIGGIVFWTPGVGTCWLLGTDNISKGILELKDFWGKLVEKTLERPEVHRIQLTSASYHKEAHWLAKKAGLTKEGPGLKQYGKNGETFFVFRKVKKLKKEKANVYG